jgi:bacterioferritin-associated ferredoxin
MIICHCEAISDRHVELAVRSGAGCPDEVADRCGAGTVCGGCRPSIEDLLATLLAEPTRKRTAA